jgi:hypothetical protein
MKAKKGDWQYFPMRDCFALLTIDVRAQSESKLRLDRQGPGRSQDAGG